MKKLISKVIASKKVKQSFDDLMYARTSLIINTIEANREISRKTGVLVFTIIEALVEQ